MAREFAKQFYNSAAWIKTSHAFASSKLFTCEKCGRPGYIVHHKTHLSPANIDDPKITLSWDNLMYLCLECHNAIHAKEQGVRAIFDADGNMVGVSDGKRQTKKQHITRHHQIIIVGGAPGSGKTYYVRNTRRDNDLVYDMDYLSAATALTHDIYKPHAYAIGAALSMRDAFISYVSTDNSRKWGNAYIITAEPDISKVRSLADRIHASVRIMPTTKEQCILNVNNDERRADKRVLISLIDSWFASNPP